MPIIGGVAGGAGAGNSGFHRPRVGRGLRKVGLTTVCLILRPAWSTAQDSIVNIYQFVLGVDVPESPSLVALGLAPMHVLRGSAPKPLAAMLVTSALSGADGSTSLSIDFSPYFLAGGGRRPLASYRSSSVIGRLLRVLTKTIVSIGGGRVSDPDETLLGVGLRATIHDPHDPVLNSRLPEEVHGVLAGTPVTIGDEEVTGFGPDLGPVFARFRRDMRKRSGDAQISLGYGAAWRARGGALEKDSIANVHHDVWAAAQYTLGARYDLLATIQLKDVLGENSHSWLGAGVLRKIGQSDLLVELYYDTDRNRLHPGLGFETRVLSNLSVLASTTTQAGAELTGTSRSRRLALRLAGKLFLASD